VLVIPRLNLPGFSELIINLQIERVLVIRLIVRAQWRLINQRVVLSLSP